MPDQWIIEWHDYYHILQIGRAADPEVINAAHKALAKNTTRTDATATSKE